MYVQINDISLDRKRVALNKLLTVNGIHSALVSTRAFGF
jgi:hypothetical protein